ncbi:hypothetical protein BG006_004513 [Podila minutissima]|uniref:DUF7082 domain-containing protein n=1 Tax=Podila minutissima TaxID=64525 RepID=A0A9P5VQV9_9FUNG|nr:hypothetical protein BG006_004513 [Podila minutissima]
MPSTTITPSSRSSDFEPRKFTPMSELQPQPTTPQDSTQTNISQSLTPTSQNSPVSQQQLPESIQQLTSFKTPLPVLPPRVLEYAPHYGPEGQTFTMTLQSNTEKTLRIGFGTLVVDTKQYSANGYVTLSCTVPSFAITKWFVSKVPLYVLQMENDMVMESWPFGDYNYYDNMGFGDTNGVGISAAPQQSSNKRAYAGPQDLGGQSPLETKRPHLELDLSQTQLAGSTTQPLSPLPPSTSTSAHNLAPRHDDYNITSSSAYDGLYSQMPTSPYGSRPALPTTNYARPGYYNTNQMIAPHLPTYTPPEIATSAYLPSTTGQNTSSTYAQSHPQPVAPSSYMPQPHPSTSMGSNLPLTSYPYSGLLNKASLKFNGNMDDMAINWSGEEWESHRRLVQFWRRQEKNEIHCSFAPVAPADRQPNSIVISCIYWAEKNDCFLTSVDCIYLLESLIAVRFTVEEKNRIRRNLEGFRPITVSKCKPESAEFFKLIMSFPNPKPRNIEKDVKVFPWKVLPYALKKIISKYTASYSSTASIQTDAFHNANFPHGSTLPVTQQQQAILDSSIIP